MVRQLVLQWKSAMTGSESLVCNVHRGLARATLDAIGEGTCNESSVKNLVSIVSAAFGYQFGTMDNRENKLGKTCEDML
jgi:hypothetical protein